MAEPRPNTPAGKAHTRWQRRGALAWLLTVLAAIAGLGIAATGAQSLLSGDLLALLPAAQRSPAATLASQRMAHNAERQVIVLLRAGRAAVTAAAADAVTDALGDGPWTARTAGTGAVMRAWISDFAAYRRDLLAREDVRRLGDPGADAGYWSQRALRALHAPVPDSVLAWRDDPFGWYGAWLQEILRGTPGFDQRDGHTWVRATGGDWLVLQYQLDASPFARGPQRRAAARLHTALARARQLAPGIELLRAGVLFHAIDAADTAEREIALLGGASLACVLLLLLAVFGSLRPLAWLLAPVTAGAVCATALTVLVFGQVHLLTLVFGTSLIGIGVDYAVHVLVSRYGADVSRGTLPGGLRPALLVAMLSTVTAYLVVTATPLPGLRQMGFFVAAGIVTAWLSTLAWLPLARVRGDFGGAGRWLGAAEVHWPAGRASVLALAGVTAAAALFTAVHGLRIDDDVRTLFAANRTLLREQVRAEHLLALPSPGQYFVVSAASADALLEREERLRERLAPLLAAGRLGLLHAVSRWVPSAATRERNRALQSRLLGAMQRFAPLQDLIEDGAAWRRQLLRPPPVRDTRGWLDTLNGTPAGGLWLHQPGFGFVSVVALHGIADSTVTRELAALAGTAGHGVTWVDLTASATAVLAGFRGWLATSLALAYLLVSGLLWWRYRSDTWRVMAAPLIATAVTLALFSALQLTVNLFVVCALFLVMGMGLDFGVFMTRCPPAERRTRWIAVTASAFTTLAAIGMLALSATPVIRTFGLTTLLGVVCAWLVTPCVTRPAREAP